MRSQDIKDLKNKSDAELEKLMKEERENLQVLKFDLDAGKVKNISQIWKTKKNIARLLTILKERQLGLNQMSVTK